MNAKQLIEGEYQPTESELSKCVKWLDALDEFPEFYAPGLVKVTKANGDIYYYKVGKFTRAVHRVGGPAIICVNGDQEWYQNNHLHRVDGPAVIWASGKQEWWLDGHRVSQDRVEYELRVIGNRAIDPERI